MKFCRLSRRHFLQGAGGFALSLPFLPSLMPREAWAENPTDAKFFIHFSTSHGGLNPNDWISIPSNPQWTGSEQLQLYPGDAMQGLDHKMRFRPLIQMGSNGALSTVFGSGFSSLLSKMNIIDGITLLMGWGHQTGGFLGNSHGNSNRDFRTGIDSSLIYVPPVPTIDQVMAASPNFYRSGDPRTMRILNLPGGEQTSYKVFNGVVQQSTHSWGLRDIYNNIFGDSAGTMRDPSRITTLNRVYEDYQRLMSPVSIGARISSEDADAVQHVMDSINQVESRIQNLSQAASCSTTGISNTRYGPTDPQSNINAFNYHTRQEYSSNWSLYVDLIVTAINCGLCRLFTVPLGVATDYTGNDYHQEIAHHWDDAPAQVYIRDAHQYVAQNFILPMLQRLNDIRTIDGGTLLDNGLVVWQHECWHATHVLHSIPTMMAGGASGAFRTGYYMDFRNLSNRALQGEAYDRSTQTFDDASPYSKLFPGIPINRWLHTVMEGLGIGRAEYVARSGIPSGTNMYGYGDHTIPGNNSFSFTNRIGSQSQDVTHIAYPQRVIDGCNTALPFLKL